MSNTDHGPRVLDQNTSSALSGQGQSIKRTVEYEVAKDEGEHSRPVSSPGCSSSPVNPNAEEPAVKDRNDTSVDGSKETSTLSAPQSPNQNVEDDTKSYPEGGLRAWLVVLGSFSGMTASFGLMNTVGTFQAYLSTQQLASYSPSAVGWIFSLYVFLSFFCGLQIGPVFDAKGPRWIMISGTICLLAGMIGVAFSTGMCLSLGPPLSL